MLHFDLLPRCFVDVRRMFAEFSDLSLIIRILWTLGTIVRFLNIHADRTLKRLNKKLLTHKLN